MRALVGCSIVGVFPGAWRTRDPAAYQRNFTELCALHAAGRLRPVGKVVFRLK
jgi:hypothetical protein